MFNDSIAHFSCGICGENFQILNEDQTDWIESESADLMRAHECPGAPDPVPAE